MNKNIKDNIKESGNISRQAMSWLRDKKLPSDPVCYYIAYELFHGSDPEMKLRINQLDGTAKEIIENIHQIFNDFILSKKEEALKQFTAKIDKLANKTLLNVSSTQNHLRAYSMSLEEMKPIIASNSGDATINVISLLINETENIHKHADELENKLKQATQEITELQKEHLAFKDKALQDPLTKVLNRSGLTEAHKELSSESSNYPMSLLMADIDHFKSFNDEYGHLIGDKVIKLVASSLKKNIKRSDVISRFGGEEFLLVLPATPKQSALIVAESLRKKIENLAVKKRNSNEHLRKITISIGVSELNSNELLSDGIERADKALYMSKEKGRNCVTPDK